MTKKRNSVLITASYLTSVTLSKVFLYAILFFDRSASNQSSLGWILISFSDLLFGALANIVTGLITDRYSKKKMMIYSEFLGAIFVVIFGLMFFRGLNSMPFLLLYVGVLSLLFSFYEIPLDASMVNIAGENAEMLVSVIWLSRAISFFAGPIIGNMLSGRMKLVFYLNALSFLFSCLLQSAAKYEEKRTEVSTTILEDFGALRSYMKKTKIIGLLLLTNLIAAFFYIPSLNTVLPQGATYLSIPNSMFAFIESSGWIGVAFSSILIAFTSSGKKLLKNIFRLLTLQGTIVALWSLPYFLSSSMYSSFLILTALVWADGFINTLQVLGALTYFQTEIPEELRGKILGAMRTGMKLTAPFGMILYLMAMKFLNIGWAFISVFIGIVMIIIGIIMGSTKAFKGFKKKIS